MTLFDALIKREVDDLPSQSTDDELIAWAVELRQQRPRRRQLIAEPVS